MEEELHRPFGKRAFPKQGVLQSAPDVLPGRRCYTVSKIRDCSSN
jgi:hypothetical protein